MVQALAGCGEWCGLQILIYGNCAVTTTGFAHNTVDLSCSNLKTDSPDGMDIASGHGKDYMKVVYLY